MVLKFIIRLVTRLPCKRLLIRFFLGLNSVSYKLIGPLAVKLEKGIHPKHRIMRYKEWFLDNIETNQVVLDVGSNIGLMPELMSQKASFVYGIEVNDRYVDQAVKERQKDNIEYICADATLYDYVSCRAINVITLSNVLEHIEDRTMFLNHLVARVPWRDSGKKLLLIRVPMIDRDWITLYKKELGLESRLDATHFVEYTYELFEQEMIRSGIEIKSHQVRFGEIYAICQVKG
jgi:hypothetical protein